MRPLLARVRKDPFLLKLSSIGKIYISYSYHFNQYTDWLLACEQYTVQTFNSCTGRPDVRQCLVVQIPMNNMSKNKPSTPMTHVACDSKLRSVVRSYMHQGPVKRVAIGHAVVYNARAAHTFSAGIKCRHYVHIYSIHSTLVFVFSTPDVSTLTYIPHIVSYFEPIPSPVRLTILDELMLCFSRYSLRFLTTWFGNPANFLYCLLLGSFEYLLLANTPTLCRHRFPITSNLTKPSFPRSMVLLGKNSAMPVHSLLWECKVVVLTSKGIVFMPNQKY